MTRPDLSDLEALAKDTYADQRSDGFTRDELRKVVWRVAAHERARIVADIRARAGRAAKMDRHDTEHLLAELANELEADHA